MQSKPDQITDKAVELTSDAVSAAVSWPQIVTADDFEAAGEARKEAKAKIKAINEERLAITRPMDAAKTAVMDFFKPPVAALEEFVVMVDKAMVPYIEAKEEEERQAKIKAEAEEKERLRKEEEDRLALAAEMEESGETELAEEILATTPDTPAAPVRESVTPKAKGTSTRKIPQTECFDKMALIKAIAAGDAPERLLDINNGHLKRFCEVMGKAPAGCKLTYKTTVVSRTK